MNQPEPVIIVGTGAMACLVAARLSASGQMVSMLGSWPEAIAELNQDGVRLMNENGVVRSFPVFATSDPQTLQGIKYALILVKSYHTRKAAEKLLACLAPDGLAVSLQNGLGNREILAEVLGEERAAAGATTLGATLLMPGLIRAYDNGEIFLGNHSKLDPLVASLRRAGLAVTVHSEMDSLLWGKLVVNCAANPLSVLLGMTNGEILADENARNLAFLLAEETASVARALNIQLPFSDTAAHVQKVLQITASNRTSMFQDFFRGAPDCEIDAINGAVIAAANKAGVPTPYNQSVTNLVKARFELQNRNTTKK